MGQAHRLRRSRRVGVAAISLALLSGLPLPSAAAAPAGPVGLGQPELPAPRVDEVVPLSDEVKAEGRAAARVAAEAEASDKQAADHRSREVAGSSSWPEPGAGAVDIRSSGEAHMRAGSLPVTVQAPVTPNEAVAGEAGKDAESGRVRVEVLDREATRAAGVSGVLLTAQQTGEAASGSRVRLGVDYSSFAHVYGGDFGARLHLVQLPACVLTTPEKPQCREQTPLESSNDPATQVVEADVDLPAAETKSTDTTVEGGFVVLAATAGSESGAGDWKATPLAPSATWEAGGSSGSFAWSYPLRTPPVAAGPQPELEISYDSGSVDGRLPGVNNQPSWVGEGFELSSSSYIERKYQSCDDDGHDGKYDLCWKYDNASLVLNGQANELIRDDTTGEWRLKHDDGSRVTHHTGATNGDNNGEYWTVVTTDGTTYTFGLDRLGGWASGDPETNSVWTAPVFGDDSGEPCNAATFAESDCTQAWRWNLDLVEDTHGNAMTYWYVKETNNYAKNGVADPGTNYVRGGYLKKIEYGQRTGSLFTTAPQKVEFTVAERCVPSGTVTCESLTEATAQDWPDVPYDAICKDGAVCTGQNGPSFFTRKRLTGVSTSVWDAKAATPAYRTVDGWALTHSFPDPGDTGDSADAVMWLETITHTGKAGTDITLPSVSFGGTWLMNRVDGSADGMVPLYKRRVRTITSESGAITIIDYSEQECLSGSNMPAAPDSNTMRCFPQYWAPEGATEPRRDWFHKYVVTGVREADTTGGSSTVQHNYSYSGGAAWHYNDDPMTLTKYRTWSVWRGFAKVTTTTGDGTGTRSKSTSLYLRGMHGDKQADGSTRNVTVTDSRGGTVTDHNQYAGFTRETITYNGTTGPEISGTISDPWSAQTASRNYSWGTTKAYYLRTGATHTRTAITGGAVAERVHTTTAAYDDHGMPYLTEDRGDDAKTGDERCTRTEYARNETTGLTELASRVETVATSCAATATRPDDVVSDVRTNYDGGANGQAPTKGEITSTERVASYEAGSPVYQRVATYTYDDLGRVTSTTDALNRTSTTSYVPTGAGPLTQTTSVNPKGHRTITDLDPAWGVAVKVTDPNSKITELAYDGLGRLTNVWLPNRYRSLGQSANIVYGYQLSANAASWISTSTFKGNTTEYKTTYEIYDALLRPRQTQAPSPTGGRVVSETFYDDRGLATTATSNIYDHTTEPSGVLVGTVNGQAPSKTTTAYDGAERPTTSTFTTYTTEQWSTTTTYTGDSVATTAPAGGTASRVYSDIFDRETERREYNGTEPTGTDYTATTTTYTPADQVKTLTGPDGEKWINTYDLRGRQVSLSDPDSGTTLREYDDADQMIKSTDAEGRVLVYEYDTLGRKTGLWQEARTDANKLSAWTFDTLRKGYPDASTRYVGGLTGKAYTKRVATYDTLYRATKTEWVLPADEPLVAAGVPTTLSFSTAYNLDGQVQSTTDPAVAGLASEKVSNTYDSRGMLTKVAGASTYLHSAAYTQYGEPQQYGLGYDSTAYTAQQWITREYEDGTRRLTRSYTTDLPHPYMTQDLHYTQDDAGNVTSISDEANLGGTGAADHQCFTYDGHRRLTEAWTPATPDCSTAGRTTANLDGAAPYWTSYTYTAAGLRNSETSHATDGDTTTSYSYDPDRPHTLTSTTTTAPGGQSSQRAYSYDQAGNTTTRTGPSGAAQSLTWSSEGRLGNLTEGTASTDYLYDADGGLLIRRGSEETILYLGATEVHQQNGQLSGTRYYTANGETIALRTSTPGAGTEITYLTGDHHGTSTLATDATTLEPTKRYTTPFGASRGTQPSTWPDDKRFLGKPEDATTGLTHIGAREYDPLIGRFISVDPLLTPDNGQTLNGYTYAANNPTSFTDPDGRRVTAGANETKSQRNVSVRHTTEKAKAKARTSAYERTRSVGFGNRFGLHRAAGPPGPAGPPRPTPPPAASRPTSTVGPYTGPGRPPTPSPQVPYLTLDSTTSDVVTVAGLGGGVTASYTAIYQTYGKSSDQTRFYGNLSSGTQSMIDNMEHSKLLRGTARALPIVGTAISGISNASEAQDWKRTALETGAEWLYGAGAGAAVGAFCLASAGVGCAAAAVGVGVFVAVTSPDVGEFVANGVESGVKAVSSGIGKVSGAGSALGSAIFG